MNDKWKMFKNYMHNELGITKEDIREWAHKAVFDVAKEYIRDQFSQISMNRRIQNLISDREIWGTGLERGIKELAAKELVKAIKISLVDKEQT